MFETSPKAKIQEKPDCSLYDVNVHLLEKKIQIIFDIRREYMSTLTTQKMLETTLINTESSQIAEGFNEAGSEPENSIEVSVDDLAEEEELLSTQRVLSPNYKSDIIATQLEVSKKVTAEHGINAVQTSFDLQSPERPSTESHQIIRQPPVPKQRTIKVL